MQEISAGILVYRFFGKNRELQVLLGKNGGPDWKNRSVSAWNIPKGHVEDGEDLLMCAKREFTEETSLSLASNNSIDYLMLGDAKTSGNKKVVYIYGYEYDFAPNKYKVEIKSNLCETEWPRYSGNIITVPELSEAYYWDITTALRMIFPYQKVFLTRLVEQLNIKG